MNWTKTAKLRLQLELQGRPGGRQNADERVSMGLLLRS